MMTFLKQPVANQALRWAIAMAFCPLAGAHAQSLTSLYQSATGYDASYASAKAQAQASYARAEQSKASVFPTANLGGSWSRSIQEVIPDVGTRTDRAYGTRGMSLSVSQPLYRPSNWATYEQGNRQSELADAVLAAADQDVMIRLTQAYFDVLAAQDTLVFLAAQKAAITEQLASAKRNFEVGTSTITDTREAQARYDLMLAQELVAQNDLQVKTLALESVAGVAQVKPLGLAPSAELPDMGSTGMEQWVTKAVGEHPTVKQARLALKIAQLELDKAEAAHQPTVDLTASYGISQSLGGSSSTAVGSRVNSGSLGVTFNLPLFAGFAHENRIKEAMALVDKAKSDVLVAERAVSQATRSAFLGASSLAGQIKALKAAEASSQSALDANRLGYQVGVRINIDVLNSQSQLFQTKRDLAKARYDYLVAGLRLRQASGKLELSDLDRVNTLLVK